MEFFKNYIKRERSNHTSIVNLRLCLFSQVHVSDCCSVADHCSSYGLSDSKDSEVRSHCSHDHNLKCSKCESISDVLCCIKRFLPKSKLAPEEVEDLSYIHNQAVQAIQAWKAHQLRSVRQHTARTMIHGPDNARLGNEVSTTQVLERHSLIGMQREVYHGI